MVLSSTQHRLHKAHCSRVKAKGQENVKTHVDQEMDVNMEDVTSGKVNINKLVQQALA
jgi:hypothetical protein